MGPPDAVEAKRQRLLGTRDFAEESNYDFFAPTIAIGCGDAMDTPHVTTIDVFGELIHAAATVSQTFGPQWLFDMYCHRCVPFHAVYLSIANHQFRFSHVGRWPVRAVERYQGPWNRKLANKVLVIGNKGDPITPLASAKKLVELLDPKKAVLLERDGYGVNSLAFACRPCGRTVQSTCQLTLPVLFHVSIRPLQRNLSAPITSLTIT